RGVSVALFPEGTRSETGELGAFKHGAFRLAITHQKPIVPIVLSGASDLLPKGSVIFKKRAHIHVSVLDPLPTTGLGLQGVNGLRERVGNMMHDALLASPS